MAGKYEQIMNMPKNDEEMGNIWIFSQILAKTWLESQSLWGLREGTVEMERARLGRWHSKYPLYSHDISILVEMERARLGRWHIIIWKDDLTYAVVEMERARLGRWHIWQWSR